jgi:hypothetical protein
VGGNSICADKIADAGLTLPTITVYTAGVAIPYFFINPGKTLTSADWQLLSLNGSRNIDAVTLEVSDDTFYSTQTDDKWYASDVNDGLTIPTTASIIAYDAAALQANDLGNIIGVWSICINNTVTSPNWYDESGSQVHMKVYKVGDWGLAPADTQVMIVLGGNGNFCDNDEDCKTQKGMGCANFGFSKYSGGACLTHVAPDDTCVTMDNTCGSWHLDGHDLTVDADPAYFRCPSQSNIGGQFKSILDKPMCRMQVTGTDCEHDSACLSGNCSDYKCT